MEGTVGVSGESKTLSSVSRGAMIPDASQTIYPVQRGLWREKFAAP
jgi:hypothetical protein